MKIIEVRRHSLRDKNGNLSEKGRRLAQEVAKTIEGNYQRIISSPSTRAVQTAEAFGFRDVEQDEQFSGLSSEEIAPYERRVEDIRSSNNLTLLQGYYEVPETRDILQKRGNEFLQAIISLSQELPEGGKALVVSHSGSMEPATLAALKKNSLNDIGGQFSECEGAKFFIDAGVVRRVDTIRLSA